MKPLKFDAKFDFEALAAELASAAAAQLASLPTPLERITCALLQSDYAMRITNGSLDELVALARNIEARLRAASNH